MQGFNTERSPIPDGWGGEPRLIAFFIPLPIPVGLPDGLTVTIDRPDTVEWLRDKWQITNDAGAILIRPTRSDGSNIVSIKVHRPITDLRMSGKPYDIAIQCIDRTLGRELTINPAEPDRGPIVRTTQTVLETVTPLLLPEDRSVRSAVTDAFDRCMEEVATFLRAVSIVLNDVRIRVWTRESLFPTIPYLSRSPDTTAWNGPGTFIVTLETLLPTGTQEVGEQDVEKVMGALRGIKRGDPAIRFREEIFKATRALYVDGDYGAAITSCYAASEALFDTMLLLMFWEENVAADDVGRTFDNDSLAKRLRTHYQSRLGRSWDTGSVRNPIGRWHEQTAKPRHLVMHTGYRPNQPEAIQAMSATEDAASFVRDQLFKKRIKYPRTSAMLFALEGLERRGVPAAELEQLELDVWIRLFNDWAASIPSRFK